MKKVALITGAAGGIGSALCQIFSASGYYVIATDYQEPSLGHSNLAIDLDLLVTSESYHKDIISNIKDILPNGSLDVLINNAALQVVGEVTTITTADFIKSLNVNVTACFVLIRDLLPFLEQTNGNVINIATIHTKLTKPHFVAYATSKTALLGLTQALAVEVGSKVRVNAISPAAIATPMLKAGFSNNPHAFANLEAHHPSGSIGSPEEVAKLALFLASDQAPFINGANFAIDGAIGVRLHDPA